MSCHTAWGMRSILRGLRSTIRSKLVARFAHSTDQGGMRKDEIRMHMVEGGPLRHTAGGVRLVLRSLRSMAGVTRARLG